MKRVNHVNRQAFKTEGSRVFQSTGDYKEFCTDADAFQHFSANVEGLIRSGIKYCIAAVRPSPQTDK